MAKALRNNVGIALFNSHGLVFLARRFKDDGPEIIQPGFEWQMPQGGIRDSETPHDAALRELYEETGVSKTQYLTETQWLNYEFPPYHGPRDHRLAKFRGQRQKWFAFRFLGNDDEIDVHCVRNGEAPEFDKWRWEKLELVPELVVPFKKETYLHVVKAFQACIRECQVACRF